MSEQLQFHPCEISLQFPLQFHPLVFFATFCADVLVRYVLYPNPPIRMLFLDLPVG